MKHVLKASLALGVTAIALSATANAQSVQVNGLGSSGLFLELGLGASSPTAGIAATCVWSESSKSVIATDTSTGTALQDAGNAWVAWTTGTGGTCDQPASDSKVYAYEQTDSVVGNRCLFNAHLSGGAKCSIAYPTSTPAPAGLILGVAGEVNLPVSIATALNASVVNAAGTDIRPEDAVFATARALTSCNAPVASGSPYLGLGYTNGSVIKSFFSTSTFNVINFSLPATFAVNPVGATPVVVVVNGNGDSTGFSQSAITSLPVLGLARFLDGTYSYADQALNTPAASGDAVTTILREPLSGTYNTVEYNSPNTLGLGSSQTSQDVGLHQPNAQKNCAHGQIASNPLNIATPSGGKRVRAIGTGQELAQVIANPNSLGYGFWSVANYAGFTNAAAPYAKYLKIAGVDPLLKAGVAYTGTIPVTGSNDLANVDLHTTGNGTYPVWSLLRLVNVGASTLPALTNLSNAAQKFVTFGTTTSRPDFIVPGKLTVVRSHFLPPAGMGQDTPIANGHVGDNSSACTAHERGGDVGGVILSLTADSTYCTNNGVTTGQTGLRQ